MEQDTESRRILIYNLSLTAAIVILSIPQILRLLL